MPDDQDDLTADDALLEPTDNGLKPWDPSEQPDQDPAVVPVDHSDEVLPA